MGSWVENTIGGVATAVSEIDSGLESFREFEGVSETAVTIVGLSEPTMFTVLQVEGMFTASSKNSENPNSFWPCA